MKIIQQGNSLTKVIEANTHITNMQSDAFVFRASISGTVSANRTHATDGDGERQSGGGMLPAADVGSCPVRDA